MLTDLWEIQGRPETLIVDGKTFHEYLAHIASTNECQDYVPIEFKGSRVVLESN